MKEITNQSSNNEFLAYVRVSSRDQSRGTSIKEQKAHIQRYVHQKGFRVVKYYEEVESASKAGRGTFDTMMKDLRENKHQGIIFHKVDRSARNPKDQALLYELMQEGFELHFVAENLSTIDPMARNMMYMLWGMASGYSENLKAEINKGQLGRLKQGRNPAYIPLGYKRAEECRAVIDTDKAPLIKTLYEDYATGRYTMKTIGKRANKIGLTNRHGNKVDKNGIDRILSNTFYYGLITHKKGIFPGEHEPLISKSLYDRVQYIRELRGFKREVSHNYIFQGMMKCPCCHQPLKLMTSKRIFIYYYCREKSCDFKTLREEYVSLLMLQELRKIEFKNEELEAFRKALNAFKKVAEKSREEQSRVIDLELKKLRSRLDDLLNKFVDEKIDDETYNRARKELLDREVILKERRRALEDGDNKKFDQIEKLGKLLKSPSVAYENADSIDKRRLLKVMVENLHFEGEKLVIKWKKPFDMIAKRPISETSGDGGD